MRFSAFQAFGTAPGNMPGSTNTVDCPVPTETLFIPAAKHDAWCDCMYSGNPLLLARCKIKMFGSYGPDAAGFEVKPMLDPSMPWTVTGKRTRGLVDDMLSQAMRWTAENVKNVAVQVAQDVAAGNNPLNTVLNTVPAGVGGPTNVHPATPVVFPVVTGTRTFFTPMFVDPTIGQPPTPPPLVQAQLPSKFPSVLLVGAGLAALWWFNKKKTTTTVAVATSTSGYGGLKRRRRRSRR